MHFRPFLISLDQLQLCCIAAACLSPILIAHPVLQTNKPTVHQNSLKTAIQPGHT